MNIINGIKDSVEYAFYVVKTNVLEFMSNFTQVTGIARESLGKFCDDELHRDQIKASCSLAFKVIDIEQEALEGKEFFEDEELLSDGDIRQILLGFGGENMPSDMFARLARKVTFAVKELRKLVYVSA